LRIGALIAQAFGGTLDPEPIRESIELQLQLFEDAMEAPPRFVDGHHHVHQLPVVREVLAEVLKSRYAVRAERIGLRTCRPRRWRGVKAAAVAATGSTGLCRLARQHGFPTNSDFAGVYPFELGADLPGYWSGWMQGLQGDTPLVMCHVAAWEDGAEETSVRRARLREYLWLGSGAFQRLCDAQAMHRSGWPH
jgi:chitin disaccharide deacetylase